MSREAQLRLCRPRLLTVHPESGPSVFGRRPSFRYAPTVGVAVAEMIRKTDGGLGLLPLLATRRSVPTPKYLPGTCRLSIILLEEVANSFAAQVRLLTLEDEDLEGRIDAEIMLW